MTIRDDRIAKGQCPTCGKEAAPFRLCYDCRQSLRINRMLKRAAACGYFKSSTPGRITKGSLFWLGPKIDDPETKAYMDKWAIPINMPEDDKRGRPRLRGVSVDVEQTLVGVMRHIGRPCTIKEITAAWGRLRSKRTDPLPVDLARIIQAQDKRARKMAKRAGITAEGSVP